MRNNRTTPSSSSAAGKSVLAASPRIHEQAHEIQPYNALIRLPVGLSEEVRHNSVENLNQLLADTITLRDLYKKHHWQVSGPTFYSLHLLFDKHAQELSEATDEIAERILQLGGIAVAMGADVSEATLIPRPPKGREDAPCQIARLLHAHEIVVEEARTFARQAEEHRDVATNDLLITDVIRLHEMQIWFLAEHLTPTPLLHEEHDGMA